MRQVRPELQLVLHTDWSKHGISGVLGQVDPDTGQEYMVACVMIRSLNKAERNYASYTGELLAVCWAIKTLRPYLHGAPTFRLVQSSTARQASASHAQGLASSMPASACAVTTLAHDMIT
jgi:hypothetical protein